MDLMASHAPFSVKMGLRFTPVRVSSSSELLLGSWSSKQSKLCLASALYLQLHLFYRLPIIIRWGFILRTYKNIVMLASGSYVVVMYLEPSGKLLCRTCPALRRRSRRLDGFRGFRRSGQNVFLRPWRVVSGDSS